MFEAITDLLEVDAYLLAADDHLEVANRLLDGAMYLPDGQAAYLRHNMLS
jgi:hypothetical protein